MGNIFDIAKKLNINEKYIIPFGYDKAKISLKINDELKDLIVKVILRNILLKRYQIQKIKEQVNL